MKSIPVRLVSNHEVAPGCFRMVLRGRLESVSCNPGQFVMLRLGSGYDPLLRRPFAAYTVNNAKKELVEIWYKIVGRGTRMMSRMHPDQELELLGPLGNGFSIPPHTRTAFVVAGGMGIVPLRGLTDQLVDCKIENVHLFLGTETAAYLFFEKRFQEMSISVKVATEDGSAGHHGLVTELFGQWLDSHHRMDEAGAICFACGPTPMLKAVAGITARHRLSCQVSLEARMACGIGACLGCVVALQRRNDTRAGSAPYGRVCLDGPVFDTKDIVW